MPRTVDSGRDCFSPSISISTMCVAIIWSESWLHASPPVICILSTGPSMAGSITCAASFTMVLSMYSCSLSSGSRAISASKPSTLLT